MHATNNCFFAIFVTLICEILQNYFAVFFGLSAWRMRNPIAMDRQAVSGYFRLGVVIIARCCAMTIIDRESPAGAWQRELDYKLDTVGKLWSEIYDLRQRIKDYMADIAKLEAEVAELRKFAHDAWVREP